MTWLAMMAPTRRVVALCCVVVASSLSRFLHVCLSVCLSFLLSLASCETKHTCRLQTRCTTEAASPFGTRPGEGAVSWPHPLTLPTPAKGGRAAWGDVTTPQACRRRRPMSGSLRPLPLLLCPFQYSPPPLIAWRSRAHCSCSFAYITDSGQLIVAVVHLHKIRRRAMKTPFRPMHMSSARQMNGITV